MWFGAIRNTKAGDFMIHSKKLEETTLWKAYQEKVTPESTRGNWIKEVYEAAVKYMIDVRQDFQNYTLHDGTHIINVLDAMGGLLGNQISKLTVGEMELLILAASLHDLGMVYQDQEKQQYYDDAEACRKFLREYCPEYLGCPAGEWTEDIRQWYLRTLHPFRVSEVLQNEAWKELFGRCPREIVPKRCIVAVCMAHGENPEELSHNKDLEYLAANDANPLFCALLLRLGDLLDFDDTRAPKVLYSYVVCNEKSCAEWDKHQASAGFRYPDSPSTNDLPYKACCTNPGVEHAVRDFLDWIDDELGNCVKLQKFCETSWQREFPFPRAVLRDEIESDGYMSGDFCLTMDQTQVLKLLTGENLYDNIDVFVRELLQNAIDATLLRGKMDNDFKLEQSRIDIWEWNDKGGNIWFRIDDQGTGMTLGMLQRYFLKVGNSYYTSREMERDLRDHGQTEKYNGISRFGIGFLSCFLCGDYAEVSTLYFDSNKNRREESIAESYQTVHYGLRLQVTGLSGYYTLKNQAKHHQPDGQMPMPDGYDTSKQYNCEREGYRSKAGTSIAIRLDPGKLGALNLHDAVEKYLCGARVPVYYNNRRIGRTYEELMQAAHEVAGERIYELTDKMKEEFDKSFPAVHGQYPKISMKTIPLDAEEDCVLPGVSGVLVKYEVQFDKVPEWKVKDQKYVVRWHVEEAKDNMQVVLFSGCAGTVNQYSYEWEMMKQRYSAAVEALGAEFERYLVCPQTEEELGEVWRPFAGHISLYEAWKGYYDFQQSIRVHFSLGECGCPYMNALTSHGQGESITCVYQGITAGRMTGMYHSDRSCMGVFFLENEWRPVAEVSRFTITEIPLKVMVVISGFLNKHQMLRGTDLGCFFAPNSRKRSLKEWREMQIPYLKQWMDINQENFFAERMQFLKEPLKRENVDRVYSYIYDNNDNIVLNKYQDAYLQDRYQMTISYEEGQTISFYEKEEIETESALDFFPPMLFCKAASDRSRQFVCDEDYTCRKGVTIDHPFMTWLLENSFALNQYFKRQFQQIVDCLYYYSGEYMVQECNRIRQQLMSLPEFHGVDVRSFPQLSMDDFWVTDDSNAH